MIVCRIRNIKNPRSNASNKITTPQSITILERSELWKKFETLIGERGVTLSGGQKQRISIARALIKDHRLVIFDDCLSAVDAKTENEIIGNLYEYLENRTAIIITHRIFSLFHFNKIVVIEDGQIVEQGTHEELLNLNGFYTELYNRQQQQDSQSR